jgi:hypothetical protein
MILQHVDSLFYVPDTTAFTALGDSDDEEGQDPFSQGEPDEEIMSKSQMYMILILLPKPLQFELRTCGVGILYIRIPTLLLVSWCRTKYQNQSDLCHGS